MDKIEALIGLSISDLPCHGRNHEWVPAYAPKTIPYWFPEHDGVEWSKKDKGKSQWEYARANSSIHKTVQLPFNICKHCHKRSNDKD